VTAALALGTSVLLGVCDFCLAVAGRRQDPVESVAITFGAISLVLFAVALISGGRLTGRDAAIGVAAGVVAAGGTVTFVEALRNGRVGLVMPVVGLAAAVVSFAGGLAEGERLTTLAAAGVAAGLIAIPLLSWEPAVERDVDHWSPAAQLAAATAGGAALGFLYVLLSWTASDSGFWPTAMYGLGAVALLLAILLVRGVRPVVDVRTPAAGGLAAGIGMASVTIALQEGPVWVVAILGNLYPATTVALAAAFLGERVHRANIAGVFVATLAVVLIATAR
jgi:drug/metabolite transporter (DMT)-like permease